MTVCGYHPYMGDGLKRFAEGLLLALQEKAKRKQRDMGTHMSREADEIVILRSFLEERVRKADSHDDQPVELAFLGIVYICQFLMADPARLALSPEQLPDEIHGNAARLVDFLKTFEDSFEGCQEGSSVAKARHAWKEAEANSRPIASDMGNRRKRSA